MLEKIENISLLCLLPWRYDKHSLVELPLSRIYSHGLKGVRAIEVLLYKAENEHVAGPRSAVSSASGSKAREVPGSIPGPATYCRFFFR